MTDKNETTDAHLSEKICSMYKTNRIASWNMAMGEYDKWDHSIKLDFSSYRINTDIKEINEDDFPYMRLALIELHLTKEKKQ